MSEGSSGSWRLGGRRVTSLDDIAAYSDSLLASSFQSLKDGRSEAHFDGLKSEAEIHSQCVDERLVGLERIRFFLFNKQTTMQQRRVGIDSISKECTTRRDTKAAAAAAARRRADGAFASAAAAADDTTTNLFVSDEAAAARSVEGAFAYAAALSSAPAGSPVLPAALPGSGSSSSSVLVLTDEGARLLESLLPELQRAVPQWEWELQTRIASLYCDLLSAPPFEPGHPPGLLSRSRLLEPVVLPFLQRMLDQEEMSEDYLAVWMQPMIAAIDALGASAPSCSSPVAASPLLSSTLLAFALKQSKDFLLSQPINVRILCVHLLGALCKHLPWRTVQSRVLDSVRALCQDTSGAVRFHMCAQIVHVLQALSPLAVHAKHAAATAAAGAGSTGSHSSIHSSIVSCKECPPALVVHSDGSFDQSHPLCQLLLELEELLKDEERDCKIRAFQSLVSTLDVWPAVLRRGRVAALVQKFIQVPPGRGLMLLIAQNLGRIVWHIRADWWNMDNTAAAAAVGASSASSSSSAASAAAAAGSSDVALHHLVKTLIAFFKNLPLLSQSNNNNNSNGHHGHNAASSLLLTPSSSNNNSGASNGGGSSSETQLLSPVSAAMLAHSHAHARSESASSLPLSPSNAAFASQAALPHEPRRYCAASFVAVASILGRVGAASSAGASASTGSSSSSAASGGPGSSSPQSLLPETRFFIDHLSSLWFKLLKADHPDAASASSSGAAGSHHSRSSSHGGSSSSSVVDAAGGSGSGSGEEVRLILISSLWEVVNILGGLGSSLTRGVVAEANAAVIAAATAHQQLHPPPPQHQFQQAQPSPQSSPTHAMRKSSSTHGLAPGGLAPLPAHQLPLMFQTATLAATTLHSTSAFKLTKDAFLAILHEHSNVHPTAAVAANVGAASSASSSGSNRALSILTTATGLSSLGGSSTGGVLSMQSGSCGGGGGGGSAADSVLYLIEGGKLESILNVYYRNHFGSVAIASAAASPSGSGSIAIAATAAAPHGVSDAVADSWSSFLYDFLRGLLGFESCVLSASATAAAVPLGASIPSFSSPSSAASSAVVAAAAASFASSSSSASSVYNWRHKISFWSSIEFLARHPAMQGPSSSELLLAVPRGYVAVRPAYLSHLPQLHSASDLNNLSLFLDRLMPCAFHGMHTAPAPLKLLLSRLATHVMLCAPLAYRRLEAVQRFLREFACSRSYWDRLLFVQVCQRMLGVEGEHTDAEAAAAVADEADNGELPSSPASAASSSAPPSLSSLLCARPCSHRWFKKFLLLPLLGLVADPVSSIRLQFTTGCPRMLPALKRLMRLPADQACVDAFTKNVGALKSAVLEAHARSEREAGGKLTEAARTKLAQFKDLMSKVERIEVPRGPTSGSGASHPPSPSASHFSFNIAATASAPLTAAQLFEQGERRREAFEDSLLRIEEAWIGEERHRAALSHSGGNLAAAAAALTAATNWTPQSFDPKQPAAGTSPNPGSTGSASAAGGAGGEGSKVASASAVAAAKAKRASQTGSNLKAMQDAVSDAAASKRKTGNTGGQSSASSSSAAGSSAQAHQAAALAASRVAAANKRNLLPGASASATSSSNAGSASSTAAALSSASSASTASGASGVSAAAGAGAPKSVRRYGSGPSNFPSSAAAPGAMAPSSSSSAAAASGSAAHNTPAASVASILAVKNHARNTVDSLLNRAVGAAPSSSSNGPLGLPPPANSPPLGSSLLSRRDNDSKAGYDVDDGPLAAASAELRPRRFAPVSTVAPSQSLARVGSAGNSSAAAAAALAGRRPVAGGPAPAAGSTVGATAAAPIVAPVAVVSMRSSKLLSANLSVSAARIVASAGNNSGATNNSSSNSSNSPVLGGPRSGSPIVGAGVRPGRAALGKLPSQSSTNTHAGSLQPSLSHGLGHGHGHGGSGLSGGSLSDRSGDSSSSGTGGGGNSSSSGGGHHHSNSLTQLSAAALLQMGAEQRQANSSGSGAVAGRRQQQLPPRSTGASSPSLPAAAASSSSTASSAAAASLLPKLDGASAPKLYSREPLAHAHLRKFKASNRAALPSADELRSERHAIKVAEEAAAASAASITAGLTASGATVHRRRSLSGDAMAAATSKLGPKSSPRK